MSLKSFILALGFATLSTVAVAENAKIMIDGAYARSGAKTGAAFFTIMNHGAADDRLVAASSDSAKRVELHTHLEDDSGVVRMRPIEDGIAVQAGGEHALERGGDHVMFMGLDAPFEDGTTISVTLTFEKAGDVTLEIPVDNDRKTGHGGHSSGDHSGHDS